MLKSAVPFAHASGVVTVPVPTSDVARDADAISLGTGSPGVARQ